MRRGGSGGAEITVKGRIWTGKEELEETGRPQKRVSIDYREGDGTG